MSLTAQPSLLLLMFASLLASFSLSAETIVCDDQPDTASRSLCVSQAQQQSAKNLRKSYRLASQTLSNNQSRLLLRQTQIAWQRFRDLSCEFESLKQQPLSQRELSRQLCQLKKTQQRQAYLEQLGQTQTTLK